MERRKPSKQARRWHDHHHSSFPLPEGDFWEPLAISSPPASLGNTVDTIQRLEWFRTLWQCLSEEKVAKALDVHLWNQIHGFLVLQLGSNMYSLSSFIAPSTFDDATRQSTDAYLEIIATIGYCLCQVYQHTQDLQIFAKDELGELLQHLIQFLSKTVYSTHRRDYSMLYLDLIHNLYQQDAIIFNLPALLLVLVELNLSPNNAQTMEKSQQLLQEMTRHSLPAIHSKASLALQAIHEYQSASSASTSLVPTFVNLDERILFSCCIAHFPAGATHIFHDRTMLSELLAVAIYPCKDDAEESCHQEPLLATKCLSLVVKNRLEETQDEAVIDEAVIYNLFLILTKVSVLSIKEATISGLLSFKAQSFPWNENDLMQQSMWCLVNIAAPPIENNHIPDPDHRIGASRILLNMMQYLFSQKDKLHLLFNQAMDHMVLLLRSDLEEIALSTADTIKDQSLTSACHIALKHPQILSELAAVSNSPIASMALQHQTMLVLNKMVQSETTLPSLARNPKVVQAVIHMGSRSTNVTTQRLGISVLLSLNQNLCNRRILARHVGLLACLIRFARSMTNEDEQAIGTSRDGLKQHIMDLTMAL